MKESNCVNERNDIRVQEIVDIDYFGISCFLFFLVILWQNTFALHEQC